MKFLVFFPAIIYIGILAINYKMFPISHEINFFWLFHFNISIILFSTIFFTIYIMIISFGFQFLEIFKDVQVETLEDENHALKEGMLSKNKAFIAEIESHMEDMFKKNMGDNKKELEDYKKMLKNMSDTIKQLNKKIETLQK